MAWIECQQVFDSNDPVECLDEDWQGTGMCRYCWDIDQYPLSLSGSQPADFCADFCRHLQCQWVQL